MTSDFSQECDLAPSTCGPTPATQGRKAARARRRRRALLAGLVLSLGGGAAALAHDFWIQPDPFWLSAGEVVSMSLLVGHGPYREVSLIGADRIVRFFADGREGRVDRRHELKLGLAGARTQLRFDRPGLQVLGLETNGTYSELPGLRFTDYLKAEGLTPALVARERQQTMAAPGREVYSRRAKALVQVAAPTAADDPIATRPVGLSLEIVPERNPYAAAYQGELPVRVFYEGRPLAGATVKLNNLDFDQRPVATQVTDARGRTIFHTPRIGLWQLNVIWTKPIKDDPRADFETTFSSLTFGFPRGQTPRRQP